MKDNHEMDSKPVIIIHDKPVDAPEPHEGEAPVITIETTDGDAPEKPRRGKGWLRTLFQVVIALLAVVALYAGWRAYRYYYAFGVPVSTSPSENIKKLERVRPVAKGASGVVVSSDSILGVAMNFYQLKNLQAEISLTEPDSTDASVVMYSRSADHTKTKRYLGSMVVKGKELQTDRSRLGYCAMANGNIVIGVARSEKVKDYCVEHGGSFFRQFVLVSDGVLPARFQLHGKVERRAIGRMADDKLYYIETRHKETMWDFADALREYGFVDAIYITGGSCYSWYRTPDGMRHTIGNPAQHHHKEYTGVVPWIVFRAK